MTSNQDRALELARGIVERRVVAAELDDFQSELLLLAAGVRCASSPPSVVSHLVLQNARLGNGYFATDDLGRRHAYAA